MKKISKYFNKLIRKSNVKRSRNYKKTQMRGGASNVSKSLNKSIPSTKLTQKNTNSIIKEFIQLRAQTLKQICLNVNDCMSFGNNIDTIKDFFENFTNLSYLYGKIIEIGRSTNGIIKKLEYKKQDYTAYAVLKSSTMPLSDNLMYEYEVGLFLNKQQKRFPCFLETYGMFKYKNEIMYQNCTNTKFVLTTTDIKDSLTQLDTIDYIVGCSNSNYISILLQHVNSDLSLFKFINNIIKATPIDTDYMLNYDLICILYQIYFPLSVLSGLYTHYDLHLDNVLLYKPSDKSYITYKYFLKNRNVITFNSPYIAKIIDYGRNIYYDTETKTGTYATLDIISKLQIPGVAKCVKTKGFEFLLKKAYTKNDANNSINTPINIWQDMKLMNIVQSYLQQQYMEILSDNIKTLLTNINTIYNTSTGLITQKIAPQPMLFNNMDNMDNMDNINNINKLRNALEIIISNLEYTKKYNERFASLTNIGTYFIYEDNTPMRFEPFERQEYTPNTSRTMNRKQSEQRNQNDKKAKNAQTAEQAQKKKHNTDLAEQERIENELVQLHKNAEIREQKAEKNAQNAKNRALLAEQDRIEKELEEFYSKNNNANRTASRA